MRAFAFSAGALAGPGVARCGIRGPRMPLGLAPVLVNRPRASRVVAPPKQRFAPSHAVKSDNATAGQQLDTAALQIIAEVSRVVDAALATGLAESSAAAQAEAHDLEAGHGPSDAASLRGRLLASISLVSAGLLERDVEVRLLLLAALCGEHLLLLGPPGTAKSELSRRLHSLLLAAAPPSPSAPAPAYFERLLTRFSVPEELFGPLSMRGLEADEYVRHTAGYLPTAEVAFVDEIFKANSAILNALLTLLNERLFDNGATRKRVPLLTLIGASNELPESEELDALYDRFLLRRTVSRVSNSAVRSLARLAAGSAAPGETPLGPSDPTAPLLTLAEFTAAADGAAASVAVPEPVIDLLAELRNWLADKAEPPVIVSDRRFMKAVGLLRVAAYADGRDAVSEYDCLLLEHVFGDRPDDAARVRARVLELIASDPGAAQAELVLLGLFGRAARLLGAAGGSAAAEEVSSAAADADALVGLLASRHAGLSAALDAGFPELRRCVWHAPAPAAAAVQALVPQMTENRKRVEELWREALTLRSCLTRRVPPGVLEKLLPKRAKQYAKGISGAAASAGAK